MTISRRRLLTGATAGATAAAVGIASGCLGDRARNALSFWQFYAPRGASPAQNTWFADLISAWNRTHEEQVRLQFVPSSQYVNGAKLQVSFSAEEGPDIFVVSPGDFLRYYNGGVLQDLTPYLTKEAREDFYPELMASRMVDGRIYALPMGGGPMAMYYSVRAFESAGLSEGDIPTTWDQLLDVAERLTTSTRFGMLLETAPGYYQNFTWYPFLWMAGGGLPGLDGGPEAFDSPGTVAALDLWRTAVSTGVSPRTAVGSGGSDVVGNLGGGLTAMQNAGMWGVSALAAGMPDLEYGVFRLPLPPGGDYVTATGGWAFAANARGRNPDAAARFCVWALGSMEQDSIDRVARWCVKAQSYLPYRKSSMRRAEQLGAFDSGPMRAFRDVIFPGARGEPRMPPEMNKLISDALQACQLNGADPAEEASRASAAMASVLANYAGASLA